jgi:hypothetical protein
MTARFVHLGFEIGGDKAHRIPVVIPIKHMAVTGQTQESGKTTTLEALITRSGLPAIAFLTKRGEASLHGRQILPYFQDRADWQFVQSILESTMKERMKFERAWIVRACRGEETLAGVWRRVIKLQEGAKNSLSQDIYMLLGEYLKKVVPLIASLPKTSKVDLSAGLSVMDLVRYPEELQMLVMSSTLEWIHKHAEGVITIIPEAWKFVPQQRNAPVKVVAEKLVREGAGLRNYLWIDSQDMAAVDKMLLRACAVWLIGVQREANEIKRALSSMPAGLKKPNAGDVATLDLGQFFACYGREIRKTYVQPAWMDETAASQIATGQLHVHDITPPHTKEPAQAGESPAIGLDSPGREIEEVAQLTDELKSQLKGKDAAQTFAPAVHSEVEEEDMPVNDAMIEELKLLLRNGENKKALKILDGLSSNGSQAQESATPACSAPRSFTLEESFDNEALYQAIKGRLMQEAPALIKVLSTQPEINVTVQRRTITMDGSTIKGRIAILISEDWLEQPRTAAEVHKELIRRGLNARTPAVRVWEAMKEFSGLGFFFVTDDKNYHTTPGAKVNVVAA